jgi:outer membrane murein-binding lipoprotein Lpp
MMLRASHLVMATMLTVAVPAVVSSPVAGQDSPVASTDGLQASRQDLTALLADLEQAATVGSREERQRAEARAARVRQRLDQGDFRAGDQIHLEVRGEPNLSGDYIVEPGPSLVLPDVGDVSLAGVLRSELQDHLRQELGRVLQNPNVRTRTMIRLGIIGEVGSPGFFAIPASAVLEDAVMTAGGPTRSANLNRIRIERSGEVVWKDDPLQQAMLEAQTLDQLNLQAGDRIVVPAKGMRLLSLQGITTILGLAGSIAWIAYRVF